MDRRRSTLCTLSCWVLQVRGTGGRTATVEGILDTGFDGFLCLPIPIAITLGLELTDVSSTAPS